ncbi:uncharacterized protein Eint_100690 [Encephalitozoon intestinalis ATCC 50506]|uniref:Uncharacterized protein n=1 Tax=Encephalitozoon intestinalis (strain ATCC 50506) TaxID=876142 RepID=E0S9L0_ENCIT|nr:uncharacterized protein Eint_100690 [Encephalitozoon intestinalis ATCC 50506]ADM12395.1 hypothetical protein Eint_100690 [Encephalitozoon intestinalis ATCC 50506]UTX46227.1 KaiC domain-containing protein [Encephalitozoon intestinalis]
MLVVNGTGLRRNSIIELCVFPDMNVHRMMVELSKQTDNPVFFDTVGNLRVVADASFILSYRKLVKALLSLKSRRGFVLFIDSISFLADKSVANLQRFYNILWMLIYENDATIVVSNHYRIVRNRGALDFALELGQRWKMMVSYRIMYKYVGDKVVAKIYSDELFEKV